MIMKSPIHLPLADHARDHLNECTFSKVLGVYSNVDQIQDFFKIASTLLHTDHIILCFHQEPYVWCQSELGFQAFMNPKQTPPLCFNECDVLQSTDPDFTHYVDYAQGLGLAYKRLAAIDLKQEGRSIGQVIVFDEGDEGFDPTHLNLVQSLIYNLIKLLERHAENLLYKELYEHEKSLNWSKTKYLQILAHDLRAPFHGLLGFSDVLRHERHTLTEHEVQNILEYLDDTAQSTYELLERVLTWAMADGGRFTYHPIVFNLADASAIVMDVLQGFAQKKNIQLKDQIPKSIQVFADINMITSVIQNLVSNAIKFTTANSGGVVTICAEADEHHVHLYIRDTGRGMTAEQLKNLFKPKLTITIKGTNGEAGAGLGLVLCKRFIDLNLGQIQVSSKEGEGTTFQVTLPTAVSKPATPVMPTL